jgi:hypothetical protein
MRPGKRERQAMRAQVQFVKDARAAFEADKAKRITFNVMNAAAIAEYSRLNRVASSANRDVLKGGTTHGYQDNLHSTAKPILLKRLGTKA